MGGQNIKVYVRARPLNSNERSSGSCSVVSTTDQTVTVRERGQEKLAKTFTFDHVFGCKSRQVDVYRHVVMPLLEEVLFGYNCTVFAYGQTGTGKTFTMEGESSASDLHWDQDPGMGIIPRTLSQLFDELRLLGCEFTVRVSFLEMYNEELFDLLSPATDTTRLRLYEDSTRKGSCIINNLEEVIVHNKNEVYEILQRGSAKRQTAATLMNAHSSRSHTIFAVTVHIKENNVEGEELLKIGKLNLVDLAGSENIGRSGAVERRAREAGNINQSLLTLGRVITSLVEGTPHVPYRESKLTRLLQDSLGGRTKTSIIATVSPAFCNVEETLSTLDYAHRAKRITNRPEINQKLTKTTVIKEYTAEIERLRRDLNATREQNGVYLASDNYSQMMAQIEQQSKEIVDKVGHIRALQQQLETIQSSFSELNEHLQQKETQLQSTKQQLVATEQSLSARTVECDEQRHLVTVHVNTERQLSSQAGQLLSVAAVATKDLGAVHSALERKRRVEADTQSALASFRRHCDEATGGLLELLQQQHSHTSLFTEQLQQRLEQLRDSRSSDSQLVTQQLQQLQSGSCEQLEGLQQLLTEQTEEGRREVSGLMAALDEWRTELEQWNGRLVARLELMFGACRDTVQQWRHHADSAQQDARTVCEQQADALSSHLSRLNSGGAQLLSQHADWRQRQQDADTEHQQALQRQESQLHQQHQDVESQLEELRGRLEAVCAAVASSHRQQTACWRTVEEQAQWRRQHGEQGGALVATGAGQVLDTVAETERAVQLHQQASQKQLVDTHTRSVSLAGELDSCLSAAETDVLAQVAQQVTSGEQRLSAASGQLQLQCQALEQLRQSCQQRVTSSGAAVAASCQTAVTSLQKQLNSDTGALCGAGGQCGEYGERQATLASQQQQAVQQLQLLARQLLEEQVPTDVPSGATPQRRNITFPRQLAATSPHQRILERHRAQLLASAKQEQPEAEGAAAAAAPCGETQASAPAAATAEPRCAAGVATLSRSSSVISNASDMENQQPVSNGHSHKQAIPRPKRAPRAAATSAEASHRHVLNQKN